MADFTDYGALTVAQWLFNEGTPTRPSAYWVKLHIGDPGKDALNNPAAETTRQQVTWDTIVNILTDGRAQTATSALAQWTGLAATETFSHYSIWDASTAGNPLIFDALTAPVPVTSGGTFDLPAGQTFDVV